LRGARCREFLPQFFSAFCSLARALLGRTTVTHTVIGRTTTGHTTSPIFGRACLRIRFAGRDRIVPHTLSTPISAAIPFEKESLFGRDQGQSLCARDRDLQAQGDRHGLLRATCCDLIQSFHISSRGSRGTTRRQRSEQTPERPQPHRPQCQWPQRPHRISVARLGAADLTAAVLVETGAACDSMAVTKLRRKS